MRDKRTPKDVCGEASFVIEAKYLKIVHGTVVNGVQGKMSLFITLPTSNF